MTTPDTPSHAPGHGLYASGSAHDASGRHYLYDSDQQTPVGAVVARFIADGYDGVLRLTAEETVEGQTETVYQTDGVPTDVPRTTVHRLTVHRSGRYGTAIYTHGDIATVRTWITHNPTPIPNPPHIEPAWLDEPDFPPEAVLPVELAHDALREFVTAPRLPAAAPWREHP